MNNFVEFVKASYDEMKNKVTWPPYSSLQRSSVLVLIASLIFAALIGVIDLGFKNTMDWFYNAF
ncbi:preprotein translocase subunit SecE [Catalinimonas niigatensis]|uniref:preprotein translocase subunit SecE n=1 Tax=Catalinimonas niigatensis TaxID=1397264 RepID=UPI0026662909|nr:preprotein translocase subunit SecE [Catalinimonas niigatensis]WPP53651.1 preprotein translocase subunit SecE [Catalinimonas niigatensis]